MEPKKIALLVGAVVVALVTALLARQMFTTSSTPVAVASPIQFSQPTGPKVLVATRALPVGTIIDVASFKYQPWPKDLMDKAYYIEGQGDKNAVVGSVVRNAISAGQPITIGSVVQPGLGRRLSLELTARRFLPHRTLPYHACPAPPLHRVRPCRSPSPHRPRPWPRSAAPALHRATAPAAISDSRPGRRRKALRRRAIPARTRRIPRAAALGRG